MVELYAVTESSVIERWGGTTIDDQIDSSMESGFYVAFFRIVDGVVEYASQNLDSGIIEWIVAELPEVE